MKARQQTLKALAASGLITVGCMVCLQGCTGLKTSIEDGAVDQAPGRSAAPAGLVVADPVFDFGDVMDGERIQHTFIIENHGGGPLTIDRVHLGRGCAVTPIAGPVPAGGSQNLTVTFDTNHQGGIEAIRRISLFTNDPRQPEFVLTLKARVEAYADISPRGVRLIGNLDEIISKQVRIVPHPRYPFAILQAAPLTGQNIDCEVMPLAEPAERLGYLLTVTSVRDTVGPIDDMIEVRTDNPEVPPLQIRVKGLVVKTARPMAEEGK